MKLLAALFVSTALLPCQRIAITGKVLDADTGEPIPRARVKIEGGGGPGSSNGLYLLTDATGNFEVLNAPKSGYWISCERPGYLSPPVGPKSSSGYLSQANPASAPLTLYLRRQAVIAGTVIDDQGRPVLGEVHVIPLILKDGRPKLDRPTSQFIEGQPSFRVHGLAAGSYYVVFVPSTRMAGGRTYRPTVYPDSPDIRGARIIQLKPGQEETVDFRLTQQPGYRITGKLPVLAGAAVTLRPGPGAGYVENLLFGTNSNQEDQTFEITRVPAGDYLLMINWLEGNKQRFAEKTIKVGTGDLLNVEIQPAPVPTVRGKMHYEEPLPPKAPPRLPRRLLFFNEDTRLFAEASVDGAFSLDHLSPGTYSLQMDGLGYGEYLKSIRLDGRDLPDRQLVVREGSPTASLEIEIGASRSTLSIDSGVAAAHIAILQRIGAELLYVSESGYRDESSINHLSVPPGDYTILAWTPNGLTCRDLAYNTPEFWTKWESFAEHVTVAVNGHADARVRRLLPPEAFQ